MKNIPWTQEEELILINAKSNGKSYKDIEKLLPNRSYNSIRVRGSLLINRGKLQSSKISSNKIWTSSEEETLLSLKYKGLKYKEIAEILNKTESAIKNKVYLLKEFSKKTKEKDIIEYIKDYKTKKKYISNIHIKKLPTLEKINEIFGSWDQAFLIANSKKLKDCILYYVKFNFENTYIYKIGITTQTVNKRFSSDIKFLDKIIFVKKFNSVEEAKIEENIIIKMYEKYKYTGKPFLRGGNSELFTLDILNLDK